MRFARLTGPVRRNGAHRPGNQSVGGVCGTIDQMFGVGDAHALRVAASQGDSGGGMPLAGGFALASDSSGGTTGAERRARPCRGVPPPVPGRVAALPAQGQTTPSVTISAGTSPATEGEDVRFKVTLSSPAPTGMYINITVADATGGGDFLPSSREGSKRAFVTAGSRFGGYGAISVDDDEPNGQITATLRAGSGCTLGETARG